MANNVTNPSLLTAFPILSETVVLAAGSVGFPVGTALTSAGALVSANGNKAAGFVANSPDIGIPANQRQAQAIDTQGIAIARVEPTNVIALDDALVALTTGNVRVFTPASAERILGFAMDTCSASASVQYVRIRIV